jgi:L-amino acid N-acyltransferase YncA
MIVRQPTESDIEALYECIYPYASLSYQARTAPVDVQQIYESLYNVVHAENFVARVIEVRGRIVAFGFGYYGHSWWAAPDCGVDFFYVSQEETGKGYGRALVQALIDGFKEKGCGWMYSGAESDISEQNTRLYENLFKKFGFRDIGGGRMILNLRGL